MHRCLNTCRQRARIAAGADDEGQRSGRQLRMRNVDHREDIHVERRNLDVLHDADDLVWRTGVADEDIDAFANRILTGKLTTRRGLADDRDAWRICLIRRREVTPGDHRNRHRLEEPRHDGPDVGRPCLTRTRLRPIAAPVRRPHAAAARHRQERDARCLFHTGQRTDPRQHIRVERRSLSGRGIADARGLHARGEHAFGFESRIDVLQTNEAANQQAGAHGLVDPEVEVRPATHQVDDLLQEIHIRVEATERVLVTTLTKRMAEQLTDYLADNGVKVRYLHSDIDTVERVEIIRDLRLGQFDVLVGINLLREGLDIPEVSLVAILDADKEGFLRAERSLIQTIGRAARNINGKAILYADRMTDSMRRALDQTERRRAKQIAFNAEHGIIATTIRKQISDLIDGVYSPKVGEGRF